MNSEYSAGLKLAKRPVPFLVEWVGPGNGRFIVLFTANHYGVVVESRNLSRPVGYTAQDFNIKSSEENWRFLNPDESITLSNS